MIKDGLRRILNLFFPFLSIKTPIDTLYHDWILQNEPGLSELRKQEQNVSSFNYSPLISVITPIHQADPQILKETILSVIAQTYKRWELCLVYSVEEEEAVKCALEGIKTNEFLIRHRILRKNKGISGNTNEALRTAKGEFVALLDHDDVLAPFALFEVVKKLNEYQDWDLIYSDHDLLSADGEHRHKPLFKPDWSPAVMFSANYLTHLTVIRTKQVLELGGFNPEMDGAQDWDLFLRVCERTKKISHIPKILYHWRDSEESTADNIWSKPYAPPTQLRVIKNHLAREGMPDPKAFFDESGFIRVSWGINEEEFISIIIPSKGASSLLKTCVNSILEITNYPNYEIIIVNNGKPRPSEYEYYNEISRNDKVRVLHYDKQFNYSAINNYGSREANGDILLFLNNDTEVISPEWLDEMVMWASREDIGVVGVKLLRPDHNIQHAGVVIGLTGFAGHIFGDQPEGMWGVFGSSEWYRDYLAVTGACLMIPKNVFNEIRGFDENFILCGNDVELCLRVKAAGLRVIYNPFAKLLHLEGATRQQNEIPIQDFIESFKHYFTVLESGDPYFNKNLSYWQLSPTMRKLNEQSPRDFTLEFLRSKGIECYDHG